VATVRTDEGCSAIHHRCLAPHARIRAYVVKNARGPPPSKTEVAAMVASTAAMRLGSSAAISCAPERPCGLRWPELMQRVFSIDVLLCDKCGGRMKAIAEISDKRVASKMLEHVGFPSDAPEPWPARGPPASGSASRWFDDDDDDATDVE